MRQIVDIKVTKYDRFYSDADKIYRAVECDDENYWEITSKIRVEYQRYIHKKSAVVIKVYPPEDYPEYYL